MNARHSSAVAGYWLRAEILGAGRLASAEFNASLAAAGGGRLRLSMVQLPSSAA